jgi:methylaspartate mutase epsilon subunit
MLTLPQVVSDEAVLSRLRGTAKSVPRLLSQADLDGTVLLQPRCGVGDHRAMRELLMFLEEYGAPDILSVTVDSFTRLLELGTAARLADEAPDALNGYPLIAHGARRATELVESVSVPLEVRHGSPDGRPLLAVALAAGITSFEGGGISYNLPYCKDVPLERSLEAWRQIDAACGSLASQGIDIDRELFGTLTAVLVPPSLSLAVSLLEASMAAAEGVTCLSIAYPQQGAVLQDVAALRTIRVLSAKYLPASVRVYPVLHEYMGPFPPDACRADELILYGALTARLGQATKLVTKSNQEALGVPTAQANADGVRTARLGASDLLSFVTVDEDEIAEESSWIEREVAELVEPLLGAASLQGAVKRAFDRGALDVPFSASRHARREVVPARDLSGSVRYLDPGRLPLSQAVRDRHRRLLEDSRMSNEMDRILADVNFFSSCPR